MSVPRPAARPVLVFYHIPGDGDEVPFESYTHLQYRYMMIYDVRGAMVGPMKALYALEL